jgi:hypothetical protein
LKKGKEGRKERKKKCEGKRTEEIDKEKIEQKR